MCRFLLATVFVGALGWPATLSQAGRCEGPGIAERCVPPRSIISYPECFVPGQLVVIRLSGDGSTDLDLVVRDLSGHEIAADRDATDEGLVMFVAEQPGLYVVQVINHGTETNCYTLLTN